MGEGEERSKVECPICAEFVGEPESVRNHITASMGGDHEGEDGAQYLAQLVEDANGGELPADPFGEDEPDTKSDPATEPGEPAKPDSGEIKKAKKVETEEGEAFSFVIYGALGLFLWWVAKGQNPAENPVQLSQPPGVN